MRRSFGRRAPALMMLAVATVLALLATPAAGQDPERLRIVTIDTTDHPRVTLTIEPPASMAGQDLPADAFSLTEDGRPADVEVAGLETETRDVPAGALEVVLVVDVSISMMGEPLALAKEAAIGFVQALPEETAFTVVAFDDDPVVVSPLAVGRAEAEVAIDALEIGGGTALYDALQVGVEQFGDATRHALVLLTDGGDTVSESTLEDATEALTASPLELAAVELVTPDYDGDVLRAMAAEAGGEVLSTDDPEELAGLYEALATQLVSRYVVTYETRFGGVTEVELAVTAGGETATTRREISLPLVTGPLAIEAPEATPVAAPGWLGSTASLVVALALLFLALTLVLSRLFLRERGPSVRLGAARERASRRGLRESLSEMAERFSTGIERRLERGGRESRLYAALERAGIDLRPGELVLIGIASVLGALVVGGLVGGPVLGIVAAGTVGVGFPLYVRRRIRRRRGAFADQLSDTLQLVTGSLRAGHSVLQSVDAVAHDASSPTREEFQRLVTEVRIGRPFEDALRAMHDRVGDEDFEAVVQAVEIHREVGGDLSEILDTVAHTVRERAHLHRQVRSLSAEGRLSAIVLISLPFAFAGLIAIVNPDHLTPLFDTRLGNTLVVAMAIVVGLGFVWIRRLIRIEY